MGTVRWGATGGDQNLPWSGNSTLDGTRLENVGGTDDDVLLDWQQSEPDADTVALWHLDESVWDGTADEIIDAGPNDIHGYANTPSYATPVDGWMDKHGEFTFVDDINVIFPDPNGHLSYPLGNANAFTVEAWVYVSSANKQDIYAGRHNVISSGVMWGLRAKYYSSYYPPTFWFRGWDKDADNYERTAQVSHAADAWHHFAATYDGTELYVYFDGNIDSGPRTVDLNLTRRPGQDGIIGKSGWHGKIDEIEVTAAVKYNAEFSPHRYETGTAIAEAAMSGIPMSRIDFSVDETAGGSLEKIWVNDSGTWTQVGGDNPTSPITGFNVTPDSNQIVKAQIAPKADTLQSETPTLDWLQASFPKQKASFTARELSTRFSAEEKPTRFSGRELPKRFSAEEVT